VSSPDAGAKLPVNPWPHTIGFVLAAGASVDLLVRFRLSPSALAVMGVYACGLVLLFGSSSVYHGLGGRQPRLTPVLRRIDHAAIYVMMAGSYTPIAFFGLDGAWRVATIAAVWMLAGAGVALASRAVRAPRPVSTMLYVAFGWAALIPAIKLVERLPHPATVLIAAGGVLYTLGAVVYATKALDVLPGRFGFHEIFHCFVVGGAALHFVAIAYYIAPPA
jgi:hemolysin III